MKESRYTHLFSGEPTVSDVAGTESVASRASSPANAGTISVIDRLASLEEEVAHLRQELAEVQQQLAAFRRQFE
jgi:uncharacterized protein YceH (UPF0502 family)